MPCTTILVGKNASYDGSTIISRNDDGRFEPKKVVVINPKDQPKKYKSVLSKVEIELPDNPLRYISTPNIDEEAKKRGIWPANGVNSANVGITATETVTSNPRVLAADPLVVYQPKDPKVKGSKEVPGGIGEEDIVLLVIPYVKTAREAVLRLGYLLETYGTYEMNGIAFNDESEVWWLESIGGHHWIARRVADDEVVVMPNQFGLDRFDFDDAMGEGKDNLCSKDLKDFVINNHLYTGYDFSNFNPRLAFGSRSDADHCYNTPRAWFICRYFMPRKYNWDGNCGDFTPESDDLPWSFKPEKKVTIEDIRYLLGSYYQGTKYNPYGHGEEKGKYRSIGVPNTDVCGIIQIRGYLPDPIKAVQWLSMGGSGHTACFGMYCNVGTTPEYISKTGPEANMNYFYWASRYIAALVDANFATALIYDERYINRVYNKTRQIMFNCDNKFIANPNTDPKELEVANKEICKYLKKFSDAVLGEVLYNASIHMKTRYNRGDN